MNNSWKSYTKSSHFVVVFFFSTRIKLSFIYFLIIVWCLLISCHLYLFIYFLFIHFQQKRDASGAAIAIFTANHHSPTNVTHKTTLQGVVYQLDVALQSPDTQKAGLVFIYDMSGSKYSNFDYDLSQKILTLLKVSRFS